MQSIESGKVTPALALTTLPQNESHTIFQESAAFGVHIGKESPSSRRPLSAVIDRAPIILFALDERGIYTLSEGQGLGSLGEKPGQRVGCSVHDLHRDRPQVLEPIRRAYAGETLSAVAEVRGQHFETYYTPVKDRRGRVVGVSGFSLNVTARVQAEESLRSAEAKYRGIFENAVEGIFQTGIDGRVLTANPTMTRILGYESFKQLSAEVSMVQELYADPSDRARFVEAMRQGTASCFPVRFRRRDGALIWLALSARLVRDDEGNPLCYEGFAEDITARKQAEGAQRRVEDQLRHLAYYDTLTGLPNREGLLQRLMQALDESGAAGGAVAVLRLNIDDFRHVNDSLGYDRGNDLLRAVGARLLLTAEPGQTVARLAGDEFGMVAPGLEQAQDVIAIAQTLLASLAEPFRIEDQEVFLSASIGIAVSESERGGDAASLLEDADTAQGRAKAQDRNCFEFYSPDMRARIVERRALEQPLHYALERNELFLHYQPRIDLGTNRIVGVEALLRWQHPEMGNVSPAQFIPMAEETGLLLPIGEWVLREACAQNQVWQGMGLVPVRMAVNLSARQFAQADLSARIAEVLAETGLDPRLLEIELTESMVMQNAQANISTLRELRKMGLTISVDDFGTGYSSLSYLKRLPIHALKIDRVFVKEVTEDRDDAAIVKAILAMAHSLRLHVVAEGVETEAQLQFLRAHCCDEVQGFLFSRPLPAEEITRMLRSPSSLSK